MPDATDNSAVLCDRLCVSDPFAVQAAPEAAEAAQAAVVYDSMSRQERARTDKLCEHYGFTREYVINELPMYRANLLYADIPDYLR